MKMFASSEGDPSVGISGQTAVLEWQETEIGWQADDERESLRNGLKNLLAIWFDQRVTVRFEDECPDCGRRLACAGIPCEAPCCPSLGAAMPAARTAYARRGTTPSSTKRARSHHKGR